MLLSRSLKITNTTAIAVINGKEGYGGNSATMQHVASSNPELVKEKFVLKGCENVLGDNKKYI